MSNLAEKTFAEAVTVEQQVLAGQAAAKEKLTSDANNANLSVVWNRSLGNRFIENSDKFNAAAQTAHSDEQFVGRLGLSDSASRSALMHYDQSYTAARVGIESEAKAETIKDRADKIIAQVQEIKKAAPDITGQCENDNKPKTPALKMKQCLPAPKFGMAA